MSEIDDDSRLVAFADGELDEAAARKLQARLAVDAALRERLALIQKGRLQFACAFQALLATAPVARITESLGVLLSTHPASATGDDSHSASRSAARIAAAIALIVLGIGLGRFLPLWPSPSPRPVASSGNIQEDWRDAVTEYASLYTAETFAKPPLDQTAETKELARLGAKLGVVLTPARIAIANGDFRGAQILAYDGAPLGQIAYVDSAGRPILFCIMTNKEPDAAMSLKQRGDYSSASWAREGRGYMVVARAPRPSRPTGSGSYPEVLKAPKWQVDANNFGAISLANKGPTG